MINWIVEKTKNIVDEANSNPQIQPWLQERSDPTVEAHNLAAGTRGW
jgi:hypothetical protein